MDPPPCTGSKCTSEILGCGFGNCDRNSQSTRVRCSPQSNPPECTEQISYRCDDSASCGTATTPDCSSATTREVVGCGVHGCASNQRATKTTTYGKNSSGVCSVSVSYACVVHSSCQSDSRCIQNRCRDACRLKFGNRAIGTCNNGCKCTGGEGIPSGESSSINETCPPIAARWAYEGFGPCSATSGVCGAGTQTSKPYCLTGKNELCGDVSCSGSTKPAARSQSCTVDCCTTSSRCSGNSVVTTTICGGRQTSGSSTNCTSGTTCRGGECRTNNPPPPPPPPPPLPCSYNPSCTSKSSSTSNCGTIYPTACHGGCNTSASLTGGTQCASGQMCSNGRCVGCTGTSRAARWTAGSWSGCVASASASCISGSRSGTKSRTQRCIKGVDRCGSSVECQGRPRTQTSGCSVACSSASCSYQKSCSGNTPQYRASYTNCQWRSRSPCRSTETCAAGECVYEGNPPVPGRCGSSRNSCSRGSFSDRSDTSSHYRWSCRGSNGGRTASCSTTKSCSSRSAYWRPGSWSSCGNYGSCSGSRQTGTRSRSVTCNKGQSNTCRETPCLGIKPPTSASCSRRCCTPRSPSWSTGSWGACTGGTYIAALGRSFGGTQTRSVTCNTGRTATCGILQCTTSRKPARSRSC